MINPLQGSQISAVRTAAELQMAIRQGVRHISISRHLDLTAIPLVDATDFTEPLSHEIDGVQSHLDQIQDSTWSIVVRVALQVQQDQIQFPWPGLLFGPGVFCKTFYVLLVSNL